MKNLLKVMALTLLILMMTANGVMAAGEATPYAPKDLTAQEIHTDDTHPYGSAALIFTIIDLPRSTGASRYEVAIEKKIGTGNWVGVGGIPSDTFLDQYRRGSDQYVYQQLWVEDYAWDGNTQISFRVCVKHYDETWSYTSQSAYSNEAYIGLGSGKLPGTTPTTTTPTTTAPTTSQPTTTVTTPVTTPAVTTTAGLSGHYKFEGNLTDSSGKGHHGSEVGSLAYATGGASGQALKLENGGYVKIPGASTLNLGEQFTLNAWVKLAAAENDVNRYNTVLFKEHPTEPGYFIYKAVASGTHDVRLDLQQLTTGFEPVVSTDGVGSLDLSSKWTMATWASDGENLSVYVDGKLQATATTGKKEYGTPFSDTITSNLFIGGPKANSAEPFNGQIDEVKLFSRALSASEIKAEYDAVKGGGGNVIQLWIGQNRMVSDNVESTIDSAPVVLNGRTLVPVRPIIEAMGGTVAFDPATRKIDLTLKGRSLTLWLDKYEAVVNGQNVTLEVAPTVIGGRTMLPLRFAAESLGASLEWDAVQQKITLKYTK